MKRNLLLFFVLCSSWTAYGQNWAPINNMEKFCYSSDDNMSIIDNVLWVEEFELIGDDQLFHLNKIARPVEGQSFQYLDHEPQFLLDDVLVKPNGEWLFIDTSFNSLDLIDTFLILPHAQHYDSWSFSDDLNASVATLTTQEIFGEIDSVKIILLSDYTQIHLSKNYGIISWRNQFELLGIEGRDLGITVPDFDDMYTNITAGDVVCLFIFGWEAGGGVVEKTIRKRYDIETVSRFEDSILINAYVRTKTQYTYWKGKIEDNVEGFQDIVFYRSTYTDVYPNEVISVSIWENYAWGSGYAVAKLDEFKWGGMKKTQICYDGGWPNSSLYEKCEGEYNDELCEYWDETALVEQSAKYGFLEYDNTGNEWGGNKIIKGVIDNGLTHGSIYPIDMFVGTDLLNPVTDWYLYPNPANDFIYISSSEKTPLDYQIYDVSGRLIESGILGPEETLIDIQNLAKGIFLLKYIQNSQTEVFKFLKE